jgi:hypothetical protein
MGFNLSQIVNKQLSVQEQTSRNFVFVPPRVGSNLVLNNMSVGKSATLFDGFNQIYDTSATYSSGQFHFRGRRIGILLSLYSTYGILGFDIDGVDYGTYDCSKNVPTGTVLSNVPYIIATDLPDGEHILTFTKLSGGTSTISIQGFMVEDSGNVQTFMRTGYNFHDMLDGNLANVKAIGTSDTTINSVDTWVHNLTLTNTTASPINITLKNNTGILIGPFPVSANDVRQLSGPLFFKGSFKAVATATGINLTMGGQ